MGTCHGTHGSWTRGCRSTMASYIPTSTSGTLIPQSPALYSSCPLPHLCQHRVPEPPLSLGAAVRHVVGWRGAMQLEGRHIAGAADDGHKPPWLGGVVGQRAALLVQCAVEQHDLLAAAAGSRQQGWVGDLVSLRGEGGRGRTGGLASQLCSLLVCCTDAWHLASSMLAVHVQHRLMPWLPKLLPSNTGYAAGSWIRLQRPVPDLA